MYRFIVVMLLCGSSVIASERLEFCGSWEDIAKAAMTSRQAGVPLKTMLMLVSDETAIGIFTAAYDYPQLESAADRQASVSRFVELVLSECLKS